MPTVLVTVRQQGRQVQQIHFQTPVDSSFAREQLQQQYGPGLLCLESSNTVVAASRALQPSESYTYELSAGGSSLALSSCQRLAASQRAKPQPCAAATATPPAVGGLCEGLTVPSPDVVLMQTYACMLQPMLLCVPLPS